MHTQTHTLLLIASAFSGGCCCSGLCPPPRPAIGPAPANLCVCAESCWEDGLSLQVPAPAAPVPGFLVAIFSEQTFCYNWQKMEFLSTKGTMKKALQIFKIYWEVLRVRYHSFTSLNSVQQNMYIMYKHPHTLIEVWNYSYKMVIRHWAFMCLSIICWKAPSQIPSWCSRTEKVNVLLRGYIGPGCWGFMPLYSTKQWREHRLDLGDSRSCCNSKQTLIHFWTGLLKFGFCFCFLNECKITYRNMYFLVM